MGGGTPQDAEDFVARTGLSPRGRGNLVWGVTDINRYGSIPAWAVELFSPNFEATAS